MDKSGILDKEKIKALMRDIQCVTVVAMSNQKGEAMEEARKEMTMMMGPQMAAMMSGAVSQMMDFELQMVKQISMQDVPDEESIDLIKELDADKDGKVSKADFLRNAKKTLFDPNPPEEIMEAMEAMEAAVNAGMPVALPIDGGMMMLEPMGGPMGGGMPMLGGSAAPMIMDGGMMGGPVFMDGSLPSCVPSGAFMVDSGFGHVVLDQSGTIRAGSPFIQPGQTKQARVIGTSTAAPRCIPNAAASPARGVQRLQASTAGQRVVSSSGAGASASLRGASVRRPASSMQASPASQPGRAAFQSIGTQQARVVGGVQAVPSNGYGVRTVPSMGISPASVRTGISQPQVSRSPMAGRVIY